MQKIKNKQKETCDKYLIPKDDEKRCLISADGIKKDYCQELFKFFSEYFE